MVWATVYFFKKKYKIVEKYYHHFLCNLRNDESNVKTQTQSGKRCSLFRELSEAGECIQKSKMATTK